MNLEHIDLFLPGTQPGWSCSKRSLCRVLGQRSLSGVLYWYRRRMAFKPRLDPVQLAEEKGYPALENPYGVDRVAFGLVAFFELERRYERLSILWPVAYITACPFATVLFWYLDDIRSYIRFKFPIASDLRSTRPSRRIQIDYGGPGLLEGLGKEIWHLIYLRSRKPRRLNETLSINVKCISLRMWNAASSTAKSPVVYSSSSWWHGET